MTHGLSLHPTDGCLCRLEKVDKALELIRAGASISVPDADGRTPRDNQRVFGVSNALRGGPLCSTYKSNL